MGPFSNMTGILKKGTIRIHKGTCTEGRQCKITGKRWPRDSGDWGDAPTSQGLLANKQARKGSKDPSCGFQRGRGPADTSISLLPSRTMAEYTAVHLFNRRLLMCGTHLLQCL